MLVGLRMTLSIVTLSEAKGLDSSPVGLRMTNAGRAQNDAFHCHPERSEGSGSFACRAQNDKCHVAQNDKIGLRNDRV
jgi:hypothetical protein